MTDIDWKLRAETFERQYRQACQDHADAMTEAQRLRSEVSMLQAKLHCMCGSPIDHSPWEGHSPVSMFDYAVEQEVERRLTLISRQGSGT